MVVVVVVVGGGQNPSPSICGPKVAFLSNSRTVHRNHFRAWSVQGEGFDIRNLQVVQFLVSVFRNFILKVHNIVTMLRCSQEFVIAKQLDLSMEAICVVESPKLTTLMSRLAWGL